jgi:hypothetical protein
MRGYIIIDQALTKLNSASETGGLGTAGRKVRCRLSSRMLT